jgi:very-short-patch-repair endonuclease
MACGLSARAIEHRLATGRLHPLWRGVYAVGRPDLSQPGIWSGALLACGPASVLGHATAVGLWSLGSVPPWPVHVSVPVSVSRRRPGIVVHRRLLPPESVTEHRGLAVTSVVQTLVDQALVWTPAELERAVNEADKHELIDPEELRSGLEALAGFPGVGRLRAVLDRRTFTLTDSELERRFLPLARRAGLGPPQTGVVVDGYKVDFYWPELDLVVETDGLRYHRTPASQARDLRRDQAHLAAGRTPLRFTHAQVAFEPGGVVTTLERVARRILQRRLKD